MDEPAQRGGIPQRWQLTVAGVPYTVRSQAADQELNTSASAGVTYWEGAADVADDAGRAVGQGYLEMTGYAAPVSAAK